MIYKCPNCNGALEYDPASDKMHCVHCGNDYFVWELDENAVEYHESVPSQIEIEEKKIDFTKERTIYDEPEFIECKIYSCSTCGAELTVSDKEVSTYCAYCGQPTIVYNRVDKTQKPKFILPFKITKDEAENAIREKLRKGFFIPKAVKKFEAEQITGIYIPYFLYDITFYQKKFIKHNKTSDLVEADCNFVNVCQDASKSVEDELSYGLEPFDLTDLKEFEPGYLSGFYADRFDLSSRQLTQTVIRKCQQMFDDELGSRCEGTVADLNNALAEYAITNAEYAFLPVWFMTFRYKDRPYTMMVNGQTGKVAGTVPFRKVKVALVFLLLFIALGTPLIAFGYWIFEGIRYYGSEGLLIWLTFLYVFFIGLSFGAAAVKKYKKLKANLAYTGNRNAENFVKERQEKN